MGEGRLIPYEEKQRREQAPALRPSTKKYCRAVPWRRREGAPLRLHYGGSRDPIPMGRVVVQRMVGREMSPTRFGFTQRS